MAHDRQQEQGESRGQEQHEEEGDFTRLAKAYHSEVARLLVKMANGYVDVQVGVDSILHKSLDLHRRLQTTESLIHPERRVEVVGEAFERLVEGRDRNRIPTGLPCLDNVLLGGLEAATITVVAGATGAGKSVMLQQIAEHAGLMGFNVLFIAVEMATVQLSFRSLARYTGIEASRIRRAWRLTPEEQEKIRAAIQRFALMKIHYKDAGDMSTAGIYESILRVQEEYGKVDLLVADYMQILHDEQGGGNENLRLTNISRNLVNISREFNIPILVGSQLSRECVKKGRKPMPQDLRESGSIENDATTVILLYPFNDSDVDEDIGRVDLVVGKNRNGIDNIDVKANFNKPLQRFEEYPIGQQGQAGQDMTEAEVVTATRVENSYMDPDYLSKVPF